MPDLGLDTKGRRPHFFDDPATDAMMAAMLQLMAENFALKERLFALEHVLENAGHLKPGDVESVDLPEALRAQLSAEQQAFFEDAFRALNADHQSPDARQQEIDKDD